MECEQICKRFDQLFNERQGTVDGTWDLVERFVMPLRGEFYTTLSSEGEVDWHRREVYDSTAVFAANSLSASMQGNLTSDAQKWFDLRFRDQDLNLVSGAKEWLEEVTDYMYQALEESNFAVEMAEAYADLTGYGTSILTLEVEEGELVFSCNPLRDTVFEQNHKKGVHILYRRLQWTAVQMIERFGEENVPESIVEQSKSNPTQTHKIIFAVYPRKGKEADPSRPTAPKERPFGYKYVLKSGHDLLEEGGYYEMPSFVARWKTIAGSKWGKSPAIDALGDIMTLNQLKEATLEAAGKVIDPAMKVEDGALIGDLNLDRGSKTVMTDINGIAPMESGTRFDISSLEVQDHREMIRQHFFQNQLELKESPAMTATEVNVRYELMQRLLGQPVARLRHDLLDPLVQRTFSIMFREGMLPEMPEGLEGANLKIEYTGPMARAQRSQTADNIVRFMMEIAQMGEVYPEAREMIDVDQAMRQVAELRGVPAKALRSQQEVDMMRRQRQEMQAQAMEMQAAESQTKSLEQAGKGVQALSAVE